MKSLLNHTLIKHALALSCAALATTALLFTGCDKVAGGSETSGKINTLGIPKDAPGVIHINLKAANDSKAGAKVRDVIKGNFDVLASSKDKKNYDEFFKETGFNFEKDIASITGTALFIGEEAQKGDPDVGVFVVRGTFAVPKIEAFIDRKLKEAQATDSEKFTKQKEGDVTFYVKKKNRESLAFGFTNNNTLLAVAASGRNAKAGLDTGIKSAVAALKSANAYSFPASLSKLENSIAKPVILVQLDVAKSPHITALFNKDEQLKLFRPEHAQLVFGEDGSKVKVHTDVHYDDPQKPAALNGLYLMGLGEIKKLLDTETAKSLDALKSKADDKKFILEGEMDAEEFIKAIENALKKIK